MAILSQVPVGSFFRTDKPSDLLQGFLNIQSAESVNSGKLTQANLQSYSQKQFFAPDPNSIVASHLKNNFAAIAKLDGDASSISADDLVQLRQGLPPAPTPQPYPGTPPAANPQALMGMMLTMIQLMLSMMTNSQ